MKKLIQIVLCLLLLVVFQESLLAQLVYRWDAGVSVTLPDDFEIDKNVEGEFTASADGMEFNMFVFEEDLALEDMNEATMEIAKELDVTDIDEIRNVETKSGFEGKFVAGNVEGTVFVVAGLIDPESTTNFFVIMSFYDDDDLAEEDAIKILDSLTR